jgi:uncharacterized protein (UPF0332 family)
MSISPSQLFDLARALEERDEECAWRSSMSRAYYAAFHAAQDLGFEDWLDGELADTSHIDPQRSHEKVIQKFVGAKKDLRLRSIGHMLKAMRKDRVRADYDLYVTIAEAEAASQLLVAEKVIEKISVIRTENSAQSSA